MRKWNEFVVFLLFFTVPFLDLFRIDIPNGHYYWFMMRFPFSHSLPLLLTIIFLVFTVIGLTFFKPRMFCSHFCPHNTMSQWERMLSRYKLDVPLGIAITPLISFTLMCYFVAPATIWDALIHGSSKMIWTFFIGLTLFIGVLVVKFRSEFCKNVCPYGLFQQLLRPEKPTLGKKIAVSIVMVLMASAMVASGLLTSGNEISLGSGARIKNGDTMTYTYTLSLANNQSEPETYVIKFNKLTPVGSEYAEPITLQPGEEKIIPFAFQVTEATGVQIDVATQKEGKQKSFAFTLAGI